MTTQTASGPAKTAGRMDCAETAGVEPRGIPTGWRDARKTVAGGPRPGKLTAAAIRRVTLRRAPEAPPWTTTEKQAGVLRGPRRGPDRRRARGRAPRADLRRRLRRRGRRRPGARARHGPRVRAARTRRRAGGLVRVPHLRQRRSAVGAATGAPLRDPQPPAGDEHGDVRRHLGGLRPEARDLGASITTGHTGTYEGCAFPTVGGATALAVGDPADLVVPTGAHRATGSSSRRPAIESVGTARRAVRRRPPAGRRRRRGSEGALRGGESRPGRAHGGRGGDVTAMHDATERGLANGLHELAAASGVPLAVERERVPVGAGVQEVCELFGMDPWTASSEGHRRAHGRLGDVNAVLGALDSAGIRAADVGVVEEGAGVTVDGDPLAEPIRTRCGRRTRPHASGSASNRAAEWRGQAEMVTLPDADAVSTNDSVPAKTTTVSSSSRVVRNARCPSRCRACAQRRRTRRRRRPCPSGSPTRPSAPSRPRRRRRGRCPTLAGVHGLRLPGGVAERDARDEFARTTGRRLHELELPVSVVTSSGASSSDAPGGGRSRSSWARRRTRRPGPRDRRCWRSRTGEPK